ncbi:phospholipase D-like domain-containing protein [Sphingomonas oligoaromativorans]|uniref:phospholipase D-like domain-containing protein n=1 Tax=Sphingomonas oligoaromativorans TaxID=575322 RepID=UPI00142194DD|nr:phosphatidylserine/phosphatidylglycerophosphate/cardiolipin synthase family protein [Sphingomonas oligoaromativorans]NIJ34551.1 cardiolipin synthase [Sphingomonas oligoaromativorans]
MATREWMPQVEERDRFEVDGNRLGLLIDRDDRLDALMALIDGAERELRLLYYIFSDDAVGVRVRDALVAACGRGVAVSLLVDGFGSEETTEGFFQPLRDAGGTVCRFLPRFGRRYLLRNHQKIALADHRRALIGGFNIDSGYFASAEEDGWRDLGLLVEGPAAAHLAGYFDAMMAWAHDPQAKIRGLTRTLRRWSQRRGHLRWLFGGPTQRLSPWTSALKTDIVRGRRLDVIAAYFAPNPGTLRRLGRLARRGALRIVTASKSDNMMTIGAARHCYRRLLRRGARIWEYRPMKLHTKLFVVDDKTYIGSSNFDMRSLYINCEIMLRIENAAFAERMRLYVDGETADGREASLDFIRERVGWLTRLKWRIAYFLVAIVDYTVTRRVNFGSAGAEIG